MSKSHIAENLKEHLFELTYKIDELSRKELMDILCQRLQSVLGASNVVFYIYNKWQLNGELSFFSAEYPVKPLKQASKEIETYFNQMNDINILDEKDVIFNITPNETTYLLKLVCGENSYGLLLISNPNYGHEKIEVLEELRMNLEHFLSLLYKKNHLRFLQARDQTLFQLSTALHSVHHTVEVLERVYEAIEEIYPSFNFYLLMSQEYDCSTLPIKMIEYSGEAAFSSGTIAFVNNELKVDYDEENEETNIYAPLSGSQGVYGVLQIEINQLIPIIESEIDFISQFTNMVGRAIERTTLHQTSNQLVTDLQIINIASHDLNLHLDQDQITETVKKHIYDSCKAEQIGVIFFSDKDPNDFNVLTGSTDYFWTKEGNKFIEQIHQKMKDDPKPMLSGSFQPDSIDTPYHSMMIIPMWSAEVVFGVIIVAHRTPYYFSFDKFKFIQSFVQHASLAFTNSVLKEKLKQTAITDYLTKLFSRNHLDKVVGNHMNENENGAFVLFDVDDFKKVNDTYGHYVGDKVLIQVAKVLESEMENDQIAARWGGEEFALYLPNYSLTEATEKANRIREKIIESTNPKVTVSSGVSTWDSSIKDSVEQLFIRTDEALYEAKLTGKNKVVQYELSGKVESV